MRLGAEWGVANVLYGKLPGLRIAKFALGSSSLSVAVLNLPVLSWRPLVYN